MNEELYGYDGQEILNTSVEDVLLYLMEDDDYTNFPIKVYVFRRQTPFENLDEFSNSILEDILEHLDERYADPDGDYTEPTEKMIKASIEFSKVISEEYIPYACERTGEVLEFTKEEAKKTIG